MAEAADLWEVGSVVGIEIPKIGGRCNCPFRKHRKRNNTFRVFRSTETGDVIWKCYSCDAPGNAGDAVALYARVQGMERREAFFELKKMGLVRGERAVRPRSLPRRRRVVPIEGARTVAVAPLDLKLWRKWKESSNGAVSGFAAQRGLDPQLMLANDVVEVRPDCVGFGYRDPETRLPCRVKVRSVKDKAFWVEPKGKDGSRALSPLYLAHQLGRSRSVLITEGELDALSLKQVGFDNVVSLPDGAESARHVDLSPLASYLIWLVATDDDAKGQAAFKALRTRAIDMGIETARVVWRRLTEQQTGEELESYKDANDALKDGKFGREDYWKCVVRAAEHTFGFVPEL